VEFLILFAAVLLGAVIQGAIGFGLALVVVSVLTLIRPEVLPAMVLLLMVPMAMIMAAREREARSTSLAWRTSSRAVRRARSGVILLLLVPDDYLSVLFGSLVLVAVLASSFVPKVALHNRTRVVGGVASGVMGTTAGIGGRRSHSSTKANQGRRSEPPSRSPFRSGPYSRLRLLSLPIGLVPITSCSP